METALRPINQSNNISEDIKKSEPIKQLNKLITLRAFSDRFPYVQKFPVFVNTLTQQSFDKIKGRILNRVIMRIYRTTDDKGRVIDWKIPPLCYSDLKDGRGLVPSQDLQAPYSQECCKWTIKAGKPYREDVCEYAQWKKSSPELKWADIPPDCTEIIYFLILPEGSTLPVWIYLNKVTLKGAKKLLVALTNLLRSIKNSKIWDFIVEIRLEKISKTKNGTPIFPVEARFEIIGKDKEHGVYNPDESITTIMEDLIVNSSHLLLPSIIGITEHSENTEEE